MPALLDAVPRTRRSARSSTRWRRCSAAGSNSRGSERTAGASRPRRRSRPHRAAARTSCALDGLTEKSRGVFYRRSRRACTSTPTATTPTPTSASPATTSSAPGDHQGRAARARCRGAARARLACAPMDPMRRSSARGRAPRQGLHARRRRSGAARGRRRRRRGRAAARDRHVLRQVGGVPRRGGARGRDRAASPSIITAARRRTRPGGIITIPRWSIRETGRMDTLPFFRRTIHAAGLEDVVVAIVGYSVPVAGRGRRRSGSCSSTAATPKTSRWPTTRMVAARRARGSARDPRRVRRSRPPAAKRRSTCGSVRSPTASSPSRRPARSASSAAGSVATKWVATRASRSAINGGRELGVAAEQIALAAERTPRVDVRFDVVDQQRLATDRCRRAAASAISHSRALSSVRSSHDVTITSNTESSR